MRKTHVTLLFFLVFQLIATITFAVTTAYGMGKDKAPQGLTALGFNLAGLSQAQAWALIQEKLPKAVTYGNESFPLTMEQTSKEWQDWISQQFKPKKKYWLQNALNNLTGSLDTYLSPPPNLDRNEIIGQLEKIKDKVDSTPRQARIMYQKGNLIIEPGVVGYKLDVEGTWQKLLTFPTGGKVELKMITLLPVPNDSDIARVKDILGDYITFFDPGESSRTTNVRLAAKALDGSLIAPGEVFSFNTTVGERTEAMGYLPASVFSDQKVVKADGGGVCQDSSTLYQAVKQADLEVLERHSHSLPVFYVPKKEDATVAFGQLDFKFENNTQGYLLISANTGDNWLRIRLFGVSDAEHPILDAPDGYPVHTNELETDPK